MIPETIKEHGAAAIAATGDDPHVDAAADAAQRAMEMMIATGASHGTILVVMAAMLGYSMGNGAQEVGQGEEALRGSVSAVTAALIFSAHNAYSTTMETVQ